MRVRLGNVPQGWNVGCAARACGLGRNTSWATCRLSVRHRLQPTVYVGGSSLCTCVLRQKPASKGLVARGKSPARRPAPPLQRSNSGAAFVPARPPAPAPVHLLSSSPDADGREPRPSHFPHHAHIVHPPVLNPTDIDRTSTLFPRSFVSSLALAHPARARARRTRRPAF